MKTIIITLAAVFLLTSGISMAQEAQSVVVLGDYCSENGPVIAGLGTVRAKASIRVRNGVTKLKIVKSNVVLKSKTAVNRSFSAVKNVVNRTKGRILNLRDRVSSRFSLVRARVHNFRYHR